MKRLARSVLEALLFVLVWLILSFFVGSAVKVFLFRGILLSSIGWLIAGWWGIAVGLVLALLSAEHRESEIDYRYSGTSSRSYSDPD